MERGRETLSFVCLSSILMRDSERQASCKNNLFFQIIPGTAWKYTEKENTVINLSLKPEGFSSTYR